MTPPDTGEEPTLHAGELPEHLPLLHQLRRMLLGQALSSAHMEHTLLSKIIALPVFSSDAISSVAYATQEIVLVMGAVGIASLTDHRAYTHYTMLVSALIVALLIIVVTSYWQTIFAYPSGGGSYIVSKENLGTNWSLIAAGALLIDYVLTVPVSVASGVQNLASVPFLTRFHPDKHLVPICIFFSVYNSAPECSPRLPFPRQAWFTTGSSFGRIRRRERAGTGGWPSTGWAPWSPWPYLARF